MEFFKKMEEYAAITWKRFFPLALVGVVLTAILIGVEQIGLFAGLVGKTAKSAGKLLGEFAEVLTWLTAAYYVFREGYGQLRRGQFTVPDFFMAGIRTLIRVTRLIHPLAGFIVICLTVLHGYLLMFVWNFDMGKENVSGIVALIILVGVLITGGMVYVSAQSQAIRKAHRYAGVLFLVLYLVHKVLAD